MKIRIYPKSLLETIWQQDKLLFTPEAKQPPLCLRCGQPLDRRLVINALSRYADVHICEAVSYTHLCPTDNGRSSEPFKTICFFSFFIRFDLQSF